MKNTALYEYRNRFVKIDIGLGYLENYYQTAVSL